MYEFRSTNKVGRFELSCICRIFSKSITRSDYVLCCHSGCFAEHRADRNITAPERRLQE